MGFVSEDGIPYGSIDVSQLDEIEPKSDEAKAALDRLKAERDLGQGQVKADEQRLAEGDKAPESEPVKDQRDVQGVPTEDKPAEQPAEQKPADQPGSVPGRRQRQVG